MLMFRTQHKGIYDGVFLFLNSETVLGKDEVIGSIPISGSKQKPAKHYY